MAELSSADINNLPDSDFAYIEDGGSKDSEGKTVPRSLRHFPIHDAAHVRNALARAPQSPFGEKAMPKIRAAAKKFGIEVGDEQQQEAGRSAFASPFENGGLFVRSMFPGPALSGDGESNKVRTLVGKLAVFDEWAEIRSRQEGHFLEKLARGAFSKTLADKRKVPVLFQHGEDPQIGGKPLGKIVQLEENERSVDYEVELFDTDYVRSILPALEAGEFGSSFTFNPVKGKSAVSSFPQRSTYNPDRLPEVVHHEVKMTEFGPGIMPYYAGATAGVRSATDEFLFGRFARDPLRLRELLTTFAPEAIVPAETALSNARAEDEPHSDEESRKVPLVPVRKRFQTRQGWLAWCETALK